MRFAYSPGAKKSRKRSFWSLALIVLLCASLVGLVVWRALVYKLEHAAPLIGMLSPSIAVPGELVRLEGEQFGAERGLSSVELDGLSLTESSYVSWSDTLIQFRVPALAGSGLVRVTTENGSSNSRMFVNRLTLPDIPVNQTTKNIAPVVSSISTEKGQIGSVLTLKGLNFGVNRDTSRVMFSWAANISGPESQAGETVSPSERDGEYELWSDKEIRVRVPDGAVSGGILVQTARGLSNALYFEIQGMPGQRMLPSRRTYAVSHFVSISNVIATAPNTLYVWLANPVESASQRSLQVLERSHPPVVQNYQGLTIYRLPDLVNGTATVISQKHVLQTYALDTEINPELVKVAPAPEPLVYTLYTAAEAQIPATAPEVVELARRAVGREKNPYKQAMLIFEALQKRLAFDYAEKEDDAQRVLANGKAGTWALVRLHVAALRASGIPARPVGGVLIDADRRAWNHQWYEFYLYGFGWVPVDPVLASGAQNAPFKPVYSDFSRYFGSIDDRRIAYSRGTVQILPMTPEGKLSAGQVSYSLQSAREEVAGTISAYTALWSDIELTGYY